MPEQTFQSCALTIPGIVPSRTFPNPLTASGGSCAAIPTLNILFSSQQHVAEKLDLLDPESPWRKDMRVVVDKFTEKLPLIKNLLCGPGDDAAQRELPEKFPILSATLEELTLQLQSSLDELRQRKAEWESALLSRSGDMARFDRQVQDLSRKH